MTAQNPPPQFKPPRFGQSSTCVLVPTDASLIESLDDDGPAMPTTASTFANQYGLEAKPGKLSEVDRSSEAPNSPGYDGGSQNALVFADANLLAVEQEQPAMVNATDEIIKDAH
eukprot:1109630-Pelagomonas_calceolata.AAC.4